MTTATASAIFTAAHFAAKVADKVVTYKVRFSTALKAAWATAKQTIQTVMNTPAKNAGFTDIQVVVAENEDYKIYLQGCYNAAGLGDSDVKIGCKQAGKTMRASKFGYKESAKFQLMGWVEPSVDEAGVHAFLAQNAQAIQAAQVQFVQDFRSDFDKAESQGMDNLMNDRTEQLTGN